MVWQRFLAVPEVDGYLVQDHRAVDNLIKEFKEQEEAEQENAKTSCNSKNEKYPNTSPLPLHKIFSLAAKLVENFNWSELFLGCAMYYFVCMSHMPANWRSSSRTRTQVCLSLEFPTFPCKLSTLTSPKRGANTHWKGGKVQNVIFVFIQEDFCHPNLVSFWAL